MQLESLDGSIINQTLTNQWNTQGSLGGWMPQSLSLSRTEIGDIGTIQALDSLSLSAGNNIDILGAKLTSGGAMDLLAGAISTSWPTPPTVPINIRAGGT